MADSGVENVNAAVDECRGRAHPRRQGGKQGNVRYLGEDTKELENGVVVSTAGEDQATVIADEVPTKVPFGSFKDCLQTHNFTKLEPDQLERKTYCKNVGFVLTDAVQGDPKHEELVSITRR